MFVAILVKNYSARNFERIVHMEPTPVEMQSFTTVQSVFLWAQLKGDPLQKLLYILGVEVDDHPRVLAAVSESDWDDAISKWSAVSKPASPAQKAKAVVAKGTTVLKTTGLRVGEQVAVTSTVPNVSTGSGLGKFNFNTVTNRSSEAGELKVAYDNYKAVFGVLPPVEEELTAEQLTAVQKFLEGVICRYVDFAVWVPHGNRMMRKLKLQGTTFSSDGSTIPIEVTGPPDIDCWSKSYACLRTALISWKAVELGRLDMYANMIKRYVSRYGSSVWFQVYQAESRCRSEHMERVRRRGEEERARAMSAGMSHPLNPRRPWDWVWGEVLTDAHFWRIELEEPALLILSRSIGRFPSSDNVAQIPSGKRWFREDSNLRPPPELPKTHDVNGNSFVANRRGRRLCDAFNTGACVFNPQNAACPNDGTFVHQCSRCLDTSHGAHACPRTDFPASRPIVEGLRGKSKGFGKGKGKQKGRWQS